MEDVNKNTEANTEKTFDWRSIILKVVLGIVVFIVVVCVIPYIINCLILKQARFDIVGDGTHWLSFWASYLAAIASFAMVLITWWTLRESKKQNQDILAQNNTIIKLNQKQHNDTLQHWEDEVRPYIEVRVVKNLSPRQVYLEFLNIGKTTARDITFSFKPSFLEKINNEEVKIALSEMGQKAFSLLGGSAKLIPLATEDNDSGTSVFMIGNRLVYEHEFIDTLLNFGDAQTLEVYGKYGNKYTFDEVISYTNPYVERTIEASLGNITRALDNISKRLNPIDTASLENIAQSISTLSSIIKTKKMSDTSLDNIDKTLSSLLENIKAIKASEEKIQRAISRKEKQTKTNN